jgi:hypothetical protein
LLYNFINVLCCERSWKVLRVVVPLNQLLHTNSMEGVVEQPILPLYSSRRIAAFSWWSNMSLPSSATKLVIVFIRYLSVAAAWKKLVL